jgi:hypothetical protein
MIQAGEQLLIFVVNSYQLLCVLRLTRTVVQVSKATEQSAMIKLPKMSSMQSSATLFIMSWDKDKLPLDGLYRN